MYKSSLLGQDHLHFLDFLHCLYTLNLKNRTFKIKSMFKFVQVTLFFLSSEHGQRHKKVGKFEKNLIILTYIFLRFARFTVRF